MNQPSLRHRPREDLRKPLLRGDVLVVLATPEQLDELAVLAGGWEGQ